MLDYLDFDTSDDDEGNTSFDAMAYAQADRWPALLAEVEQVLDWCTAKFGRPGFEPLSNESTALNIEEAIRLNASLLAVQVFIGSAYERQSLKNLTDLVDAGARYGIAVMGVVAVGRAMARNAQYFRLATRISTLVAGRVIACDTPGAIRVHPEVRRAYLGEEFVA